MEKINPIKTPISKINGLNRTCHVGQVAYLDFHLNECKIKYVVEITSLNISQDYWIHISDSDIVNSSGQKITKELTDSTFVLPPLEEDNFEPLTDLEIELLKVEHYKSEIANGNPGFTHWWAQSQDLTLGVAMQNSISLLDTLGFFN